jgi:hypothetical protein
MLGAGLELDSGTFLEFEVLLGSGVDEHVVEEEQIPLLVVVCLAWAELHEVPLFDEHASGRQHLRAQRRKQQQQQKERERER